MDQRRKRRIEGGEDIRREENSLLYDEQTENHLVKVSFKPVPQSTDSGEDWKEKQAKKTKATKEASIRDVEARYHILLENVISHTLAAFIKYPTLYVDIVLLIFSATNTFMDEKIKELVTNIGKVLGISSQKDIILDIILNYPNSLPLFPHNEVNEVFNLINNSVHSSIGQGRFLS